MSDPDPFVAAPAATSADPVTARRGALASRRVQYETAGLDVGDVGADPVRQWQRWYDDAAGGGVTEPNSMALATVDESGHPDVRLVLVRGLDEAGFVFYTNYDSPKSRQLEATPSAAGVFSWVDLHRQVRVRGAVSRVGEPENDEYFASRPREHQIGAWASPQSAVLRDRAALERLVAETAQRFEGDDVPRPPSWGGWRLGLDVVEFWQGRRNRLHDRLRYRRERDAWVVERLAP